MEYQTPPILDRFRLALSYRTCIVKISEKYVNFQWYPKDNCITNKVRKNKLDPCYQIYFIS